MNNKDKAALNDHIKILDIKDAALERKDVLLEEITKIYIKLICNLRGVDKLYSGDIYAGCGLVEQIKAELFKARSEVKGLHDKSSSS